MGLEGAYGLSSLQQMIRQRIADQLAQKQQDFENVVRTRDLGLRESEAAQRGKYQDAQLEGLNDQRSANADLRRQRAADDLEKTRTIGDVLDPSQVKMLRDANRGNDVEHQTGTVGSTQYDGFASLPSPGAVTRGVLRRADVAGTPAQDVYRGNAPQREATQQKVFVGKLISRLPADSRERMALEYEQMTGKNPPAGVFEPKPPKEPTPHYQFLPTYDETGNPNGVVAGNTLTGTMSPATVPGGASIRPSRTADNPQLPRGVQDYLVQLRGKYGNDLQAAEAEFGRALADIRKAHPHLDSAGAVLKLRQMFGEAPGVSSLDQLLGASGGGFPSQGGILNGAQASTGRGGAPAGRQGGGGMMTRTELRAVASKLGITEQEAEAQARSRGLSVR